MKSIRCNSGLVSAVILAVGAGVAQADQIGIPNFSFESQSAVGQPQGVNINIDSWQKIEQPAHFSAVQQNYGIFWLQTAGAFLDTNPYNNKDGAQAAYLLSFPQVTLFQTLSATYQVGQHYDFTLGVFGKNMTDGETLALSFFYLSDGLPVAVGTPDVITYSAAGFPIIPKLNLFDNTASIGEVGPADAWAGKNIGIKIESVNGYGDGYWDMDNARLVQTPEPATIGMIVVGLGGLLLALRCARH